MASILSIGINKNEQRILTLILANKCYYVSILDLNLNLVKEIKLDYCFGIENNTLGFPFELNTETVVNYNQLSSRLHQYLLEVDFESQEVSIYSKVREYSESLNGYSDWKEIGFHILTFNFNGGLINEKLISRESEINVLIKGINGYKHLSNQDYIDRPIVVYNNQTKKIDEIDILEACYSELLDLPEYEYCESIVNIKECKIGFITVNTTWPYQGIKIIDLKHSNNLEFIYELDEVEIDGFFHNLAYNDSLNKVSVILLRKDDRYITFLEYSLNDESKKPIRTVQTKILYNQQIIKETKYVTNDSLCVVFYSHLIIIDLKTGIGKTIKRDEDSLYLIDINLVLITENGTMKIIRH